MFFKKFFFELFSRCAETTNSHSFKMLKRPLLWAFVGLQLPFCFMPSSSALPFFGDKKLPVRSQYVDKTNIDGLELNLQVWFPKTRQTRPVILFFTGMTGLITSKVYDSFIKQMAAKGVGIITLHSKQIYPGQFKATAEESYNAYQALRKNLNSFLNKKHRGLAKDLLDWDQTIIMGHSSGAQPVIAFYRLAKEDVKGVILLDPVDGDPFGKTEKSIKRNEKNDFNAPLLISGTELCKQPGYDRKWFPPCCPQELSSEHFFAAFKGPKWYVNALDYAHVDLLDDGFTWAVNKTRFCKPSDGVDTGVIKKFNAELISDFVQNTLTNKNKKFTYLKKSHPELKIEIEEKI
ncbi:MAG: hypothetical protein AB8G05_26845 [Oligoflexales bacterium]